MGEYIKKDGLYQKVAHLEELARRRYLDTPLDSPLKDRYLTQLNERISFKHMIADECAEDVAPVIHGRWELAAHFDRDDGTTDIRCSACGTTRTVKGCYESVEGDCLYNEENFCPDCGALMDMELGVCGMAEYLKKRVVYAGDVHTELMKSGWTPADAARLLKCVPDANVAPVVQGKWEEYCGEDAGFHYCSACKGQAFNYEDGKEVIEVLSNYCPNCGVKMDLEGGKHNG